MKIPDGRICFALGCWITSISGMMIEAQSMRIFGEITACVIGCICILGFTTYMIEKSG